MANLMNAAPKTDHGGYVYPDPGRAQSAKQRLQLPEKGITLRDWFAGKALEGMLGGEPGSHLVPPNAAELAFEYADAMLKQRAKFTAEQNKEDVK